MASSAFPEPISGIKESLLDATGDILYASADNTPARLGIGSSGQSLVVASGIPSWATASSGDFIKIVTGTFTSVSNTSTTFDGCFTSTYRSYKMIISNLVTSNTGATAQMQFRASGATLSGSAYRYNNFGYDSTGSFVQNNATANTLIYLGTTYGGITEGLSADINIYGKGAGTTTPKFMGTIIRSYENCPAAIGGQYTTAGAFDGVIFSSSAGTVSGTVTIYGMVN